ncbi:hypothetical protein C8R46DRAFT_1055913 [Mycena filopes]|nr:hypothetical protein C8R46DRAFT_1055913 [Mycena filopes]
MRFVQQDLPLDLLRPILDQLTDRRDLSSCALVNTSFHRAATPLLYSVLDSRAVPKTLVHHPSNTLNQRPELAQYVRHVAESGAVHRCYPNITQNTLQALSLCTNLRSMTWIDDYPLPGADALFLAFLTVVRTHPLRALTIRTHNDLGQKAWAQLTSLTGLRRISIWCLEGPPYLRWADRLRGTLTHLELGVSVFTYPCSELLSQLPLLQDIRLKGAPSNTIPTILTFLPNLRSLDTEYLMPGIPIPHRAQTEEIKPLSTLQHLTVRTMAMNLDGLWAWVIKLLPRPGLETFKLHAFTHTGLPRIPRAFLLDLATMQAGSLRHFIAADAEVTLPDIECLCDSFPLLETLQVCLVGAPDVNAIVVVVERAVNLKTLRLQVRYEAHQPTPKTNLTLEQARTWMQRSRLRVIGINSVVYTGKWILEEQALKFEAVAHVEADKWNT